MASNKDFTLKRHNGTDYDVLLPTTHMGQIFTDSGLGTTLGTHLNTTYIKLSSRGANNGVATLDSYGHVPANQLGPYLAGGLKIQGSMGGATGVDTIGELLGSLADIVAAGSGEILYSDFIGYAWVATATFSLTQGTLPANTAYSINPGDEGDTSVPIDIEAGDIIFVSKYEYVTTTNTWTLSVINNTYGLATTSSPGVVKLIDAGSAVTMQDFQLTDDVVTGAALDNISAAGDSDDATLLYKIALMGHHHDNRYQSKDSDLSAIAELSNADGNFIVGNGTTWVTKSGDVAKSSLGLTIGVHVQAYDQGLQSISGLTTSADKMIYTTGSDAYATTTLTSFARTLLDDTTVESARTTLGLTIGTNVQAYDAGLQDISTLSTVNGNFIVGNGNNWVTKSGATARAALDVYSTGDISTLLTNRPTILYDTTTSAVTGSLIIDLD